MEPKLELFVDLLSQPCRSVYIFAKKNQIPMEVKLVSLMNGEHRAEEFKKVNPLQKAPALRDGNFCMAESIPMLEYMAEKYKTPDHWYPRDLQKRSRVREYLSWQHMGLRMHGSKVFWMKLMIPKVFGMEVPQHKLDAALEDLNAGLTEIEKNFIKEGGFIGGDQISIADLVAIVEIMQPFGAGVEVFKEHPKLGAWKERVVRAVGKDLFDEAHAKLMSVKEVTPQIDASKLELFRPRIVKMIS